MGETALDATSIKATFRRRRLYLRGFVGLTGLALLAIVILGAQNATSLLGVPAAVWFGLVLVALAALIFYSLRYWRCPACNKWLGRGQSMRQCAGCGAELR